MVKKGSASNARKTYIILAILLLSALNTVAQNYSASDTVTEYPNHGTFYHDRFVGRKTASGEVFDQNKFTAAHWKIKLGTYVLVTNKNTGKQVIVRINDRCPKRGVLDMTRRAATALGIRGCQPVTLRILPDGYVGQWLAQELMFDSVHSPRNNAPTNNAISQKKNNIPLFTPNNGNHGERYKIQLGDAPNHGAAYTMRMHLPENYREYLVVEQTSSDNLTVSIDLPLTQLQAEQLLKALHPSFPQARIVAFD